MDKIKKILTPHTSDKHDSTTHSSSTGTSGQGSHFNGETRTGMAGVVGRDAPSHMPGEFPSEAGQAGYTGTSHGTTSQHPTTTQSTGYGVSGATVSPSHGSGLPGTSGSTTSGPHSSSLANKADPRVDSDNSRLTGHSGSAGYGSGPTGTTTTTTTTSGPHTSSLANRADPRVDSDNSRGVGSGLTGRDNTPGYGHGTSGVPSSTSTGGALGTAAIGHSSTDRSYNLGSGTSSSTAGPHSSNLANRADPRVDSDLDGSRTTGAPGGSATVIGTTTARSFPLAGTSHSTGTGHSTTSGPHSSSLANKADPRVDSDNSRLGSTGLTGSTGTGYGNTGSSNTYGSSTHGTDHSRLGGAGLTSGTGYNDHSTTSGPHSSNLANKADPRVDSDNSRLGSTGLTGSTGYGNTGSSHTHGSSTHGTGHGLERDAAATGAGAILGSTATRGTGIGSGPHQTVTANLLDPNTRGGSSHRENAIEHAHGGEKVGGGAEEADREHKNVGTTSADAVRIADTDDSHFTTQGGSGLTGSSHIGRNAAIAGGVGAGAAGLASHEHDRHNDRGFGHGTSTTTGTTTTTTTTTGHHGTTPATSTTGHHHGRDAALGAGAGVGVGAAGVGLAHRGNHDSLSEGSFDQHGNRIGGASNLEQSGHRPTTDIGSTTTHDTHGAPHEKESLMHKITSKLSGHKNETDTHGSTTDSSHTGRNAALAGGAGAGAAAYDPSTTGSHNYGRDAALAGGAAGVGGAAYAAGRHHDGTSSTVDPTYGSHSGTTATNPYGSTTHSTTDPTRNTTSDHHYGRDAAVAGGAVGAGGAAYEADEHHKQKELEKAMQKHNIHDEKEMNKDLKKQHKHDEKEYEKELKKQHKHDEKLHEKEEKKHEKEHKGGLFGLKSHKNDKYTDEERREYDRLEREGQLNPGHQTATGVGAAGTVTAALTARQGSLALKDMVIINIRMDRM
ncbi:hypothetical protein M7I_6416 [Glarea lozoyensis 74030]|uniref:Uncharacterized protein n=1 Tax=Glarea lozoyensis (strain ATCC 74030 / MF5533) TaxID=1104152 RepID=H0EUF9_GLAL7|nr:hypothetical protein M7I_6416 [Glarea lozoyensis 74030]